MSYQVKIASGSIKEINAVNKALNLDLWAGILTDDHEYAETIACAAYDVAPWIEIDITKQAA